MSSPSAPGSVDPTHPAPGAVVDDKYLIGQSLGAGGMGVVVQATHLLLGEAVALKFLHGRLAQRGDQVERFVREARAAARIKSEHVARVLDVGTLPGGEPFIVMELLIGEDLEYVCSVRGPLPVADVVEYVAQACRALAEAHQHGIVHRDLKPGNLFLTKRADGSPLVKVLDFGISRWIDGWDQSLTATGDVLGSPQYMAPEQIRDSRRADVRSDIWALGIVLYQLLAGRTPFVAHNSAAALAKILSDPVPPLRAVRPDVAPELEAIILRCLEKSPARRFQRVEELANALSAPRPLPAVPPQAASAPGLLLDTTIRMVVPTGTHRAGGPQTAGPAGHLSSPPPDSQTAGPAGHFSSPPPDSQTPGLPAFGAPTAPSSMAPSGGATTTSSVTGPGLAPRGSRLAVAAVALVAMALCGGVAVALLWRTPHVAADASGAGAASAPAPAVAGASSSSGPLPAPEASAEAPALSAATASASPPLPPSPKTRPSPGPGAGPATRRGVKPPVTAPRVQPVPKYGQD